MQGFCETERADKAAPRPPGPTPAQAGAGCSSCGATTFKTSWQLFRDGSRHVRQVCSACGKFRRFLPRGRPGTPDFQFRRRPEDASVADLAPPPEGWHWLGHIRQSDGVWRPVALASTLAACWQTLLTYPGQGDLLLVPVRPAVDIHSGAG